ncbi:hypothetical protein K435DRAFT_722422 [Dendrothele bispora CBS 962.96]|uniref:Heterokaryon incompatibility domain-containing protein n=1 Tax=Dendrothele bispora (strain CBS 962.96) TaxID=1314807 RepID=A0A4S8M566_DENBC|nr:hypothetical protein K435DRAFT_722422 [Dendrothele bispora CBS 962.96]
MMPPVLSSRTILDIPLTQLRGNRISIESSATPRRIRLIKCSALLDNNSLTIEEFIDFPSVPYSAISYVWKGNEPGPETQQETAVSGHFTVKGAEDGDPISIDVLRYACIAARDCYLDGMDHIWLDRVCIMQTNREDKSWQITQMFNVYKKAELAIILPGGIHHLVALNEETSWVHRGWTLQEALAPEEALVLHLWKWEQGIVGDPEDDDTSGIIQIVVPGYCALTTLENLVEACTLGSLQWAPEALREDEREWYTVPTKILGLKTSNLHAFLDALRVFDEDSNSARSAFRDYAIWKAALTRTSSRPVDMVFSIMGLFDVTLDPKAFRKDDRIGATIALAREILSKGRCASWIGISTRAPPCRQLSTFPEFPETTVVGKAFIRTADKMIDAATIVDEDTYMGSLRPIEGEMDEAGYLKCKRKICILTPADTANVLQDCAECQRIIEAPGSQQHLAAQTVDGKQWYFHENAYFEASSFPRIAAVALGPFATVNLSEEEDEIYKVMLVQEHAPEKFHIVSFFVLPNFDKFWGQRLTMGWRERTLNIGGPEGK